VPASLLQGLKRLLERGCTPCGILFLALSTDVTYLIVVLV